MTEQDVREILRLARMDVSEAFAHTGTDRKVRLHKIGLEGIRSLVLGLHFDLGFTLALTLAHFLLKASGRLTEVDNPLRVLGDLASLLERKLGATGAAEIVLSMGALSREQHSIVLEVNALRNKCAHQENPSTRDGSSLSYRGRPLADPANLKRLISDVHAVMSKLGELQPTGEADDNAVDDAEVVDDVDAVDDADAAD